ncbi:MAG TPA: CoA transferase [Thermoanaerobaculia bacterium]|nr:CoA transferase [Thermoanaerobaculia bacterium]
MKRPRASGLGPRVSALPLHGVTVIDFTRILAGPLCTQMLGDAGARVIKVEEPGRGDETRRWGPPFVRGVSAYFLSVNRNKESLTLNLKAAEGRAIAQKLIERADVVIDNFLPAQRRALGLDDCSASAVHCSITGFDADAPDAAAPGYDLLAQAGAGLMAITGERDGEPMKAGVALSDVLTAHYATSAICAALFARERSGGGGARLEISLFSATIASLVNVAQNALVTGKEAKRHGNAHASIVPYQLFHGSDRPFAVAAGTDRHFELLCRDVIERKTLARDRRFATNAARVKNRGALVPLLEAIFGTRRAASWVSRCRRAGVPATLVQGVREAIRSPAGRLLLAEIDHPEIGMMETIRNPLMLAGRRLPVRLPPPSLGQHTAAVLRELGLGRRDIDALRRDQVI